jgi:hypothetical protein
VVALAQHKDWGMAAGATQILSDGTILVLGFCNMIADHRAGSEARFRRGYVTRSTDSGQIWSAPEVVDGWPLRGVAIWDDPLEMPDGTLVMAGYGQLDSAKVTDNYQEPTRSVLLWSDDRGENWYNYGTIAFDPAGVHHFCEPGMARTPDGRLVALSRELHVVFGNNPPGGNLFFSESEDGGASWSPFRRTDLWGYPADLVTLKDGSILSIYGYRRDPMSVRVTVSEDGRTWSKDNEIVLYHAPNYDTRDLSVSKHIIDDGYRHTGYPSAAVMDDGTVLAVFHSYNEDRKQIVLLARFNVVHC